MGMGMFTPQTRSGLQVTLAATLLGLGIGLGGAAAMTLSIWFAAGSGAAVMVAAFVWFWRASVRSEDDAEPPQAVPRATTGFSNEAYAFREWESQPKVDRVSPGYPQNLAREVLEVPRVYAQEGSAPPPRAPRRPQAPEPRAQPVRHWAPGATPAPQAFRDAATGEDLVEFQIVHAPTTAPKTVQAGAIPPAAALPEPDAPTSEFTRDVGASRHADFYEPKQKRYEKVELSQIMKQRREAMARDLPIVGGMLSDRPLEEPREERPGKTRGKCSKCSTYLWAPAKRPLRVRCPKCGHEARLT